MPLGAVGVGLALLLFFCLLKTVVAARTSAGARLMPIAALYGAALPGEPLAVRALGGLAPILIGVAGVSGAFGDRLTPPPGA